MWFAALGQYQDNPWLIRLVDQILEGCFPVLNLLDERELGTGDVAQPFSHIRASLWNYDFTRVDSEWSRRIPNSARLVHGKAPKAADATKMEVRDAAAAPPFFWSDFILWPQQYWTRSYVRQYLPPISEEHPSVKQFLSHHGYKAKKCVCVEERCHQFRTGSSLRSFCDLCNSARRNNVIWLPFVWLGFLVIRATWFKLRVSTVSRSEKITNYDSAPKKNQ